MTRHILAGLVLALLTTAIVLFSGPELQAVALLGAALGGALGLVPDGSPGRRTGAFVVGFAAAWLGYALRAAVLPDAAVGRAVAVLVVLGVCVAVAGASRDRLPLWAALLGAAALAGAYEATYTAAPAAFVTSSATTATSVLLTVGAGFLATSVLGAVVGRDRAEQRTAEEPTPPRTSEQDVPDPIDAYRGVDAERPPTAPALDTVTGSRRDLHSPRSFDPRPEA